MIVKIIPENIDQENSKSALLNINAMSSLSNNEIYSCELKIG